MKLYDYFRSTASYRVRIALNIKNIAYEKMEVHLTREGGEQHSSEFQQKNPQGLVPCLELDNKRYLSQSLAIIDYLEASHPEVPLLPQDPFTQATVRSLALMVACDIHPLNNLRVLNQLKEQFQADESQVLEWYHHWLITGFDAFEAKLASLERDVPVCIGSSVSLADVCLIPQVYNAHRFKLAMDDYPLINEVNAYCLGLEAFQKAAP